MADFAYSIPLLNGQAMPLSFKSGTSAVFVGANGSGKSRLGAYLDLDGSYRKITHRIGAQRALLIPDSVEVMDLERAEQLLRYGAPTDERKQLSRWQNKPATLLLNDYGRVLVALFSDWIKITREHQRERQTAPTAPWPPTKLDLIKSIWDDTIRTRTLVADVPSLRVSLPGEDNSQYPADEMSDGERVLLYLAGQCLHAPPDGVIIVDEPELHLHKAVLARFWDKLEAARADCLFIYLTHDLDFAVSRASARKFAVLKYDHGRWDIVEIPEETGLPEDITVLILGSRKPILFLEGGRSSIDANIFGKIYDGFTILPVGSCEEVIHLTESYNAKSELHHFVCRGIIDKDGRTTDQVEHLRKHHVYTIEYAEIENLLLAEAVMGEAARLLGFRGEDVRSRVDRAKTRVFELAERDAGRASNEYAKRRLQRALSKMGFKEKKIEELSAEFEAGIRSLDVLQIYEDRKSEIDKAIRARDYPKVLELCDNKGMVKQVGNEFNLPANEYSDYLLRQIGGVQGRGVLETLRTLVPDLQSSL